MISFILGDNKYYLEHHAWSLFEYQWTSLDGTPLNVLGQIEGKERNPSTNYLDYHYGIPAQRSSNVSESNLKHLLGVYRVCVQECLITLVDLNFTNWEFIA